VRCDGSLVTNRRPAPLIERLGGAAAVTAAVDIFYGKVLADDRVNHYFVNTNMEKQRAHQAAFMTYAFGGGDKYKGKDMVEAHRHLLPHLEDVHFDAIVEHFVSTLTDLNVPQAEMDDCVEIVESTREQIVRGY
jgi:hemoglobin